MASQWTEKNDILQRALADKAFDEAELEAFQKDLREFAGVPSAYYATVYGNIIAFAE